MEIINITDIKGFKIGNAENADKGTGCTVIVCEDGAVGGVDVRGGGPATRETDLLRSENTVNSVNAVVLSGGSAFGLEAASGVMRELSARGVGFDVGTGITVPIVCGASLYDLAVGDPSAFPDVDMGILAVQNAFNGYFQHGNYGAGTGATVGKYMGHDRAMKSGLGVHACGDGYVEVGAIAAVNAIGDIYNEEGKLIAGLRAEDGKRIYGTLEVLKGMVHDNAKPEDNSSSLNTTISCLITNAALTKSQANKLASILHDAYARSIKPVHGTLDGDTVFVLASGKCQVNFDAFAALATDVMQYAIVDGATSASGAYGLPAASDINKPENQA